jgi:cytosine/adenosine deaminase-related metal-dependent hydrolase
MTGSLRPPDLPGLRVVHADAAIVGDAEPVRDAAVVCDATSKILEVGRAADVLPRHAGLPIERVHGVLMPGLVNAHTHLELSALRGQVPGGAGFVPWVENLIGMRAEAQPQDDAAAIERAVADLDASGTVAVGEVTNSLTAVRALARMGLVGCIFHEVFGVDLAGLEKRVAALPSLVEEVVGEWPTPDLTYSPSPHTLYTTHRDVTRRLVDEGRAKRRRVSIHLAEHPAERRFLERGDGPIVDWYERLLRLRRESLEWPGKSPIEFADDLGVLAPHVLCVHLTDARAEELDRVAAREAPVVFCPRSNLYIESRLPSLIAARAAGIWPALGTDSLASNSSLDVLAEARALADRFPDVPARDLLRMATWEGARALDRSDLGRIAVGARPGLFAIGTAAPLDGDPCAFVVANVRAPRRWVVRRGREVAS